MKACKLCEILEHQQKLSGCGGGSNDGTIQSNYHCNHGTTTSNDLNQTATNKSSALSTSFGMLPSYLKDMFLAAHLLRGNKTDFIFFFIFFILYLSC